MQAVSISNVTPAKVPVPGDTSLLSPGPQQSSPFAALFQVKLKVATEATKLPAPGKATDSARAKDSPTLALDSLGIAPQLLGLTVPSATPSAVQIPISVNGTSADGAPNQNLIAATEFTQPPASASVNVEQNDAKSADVLVVPAYMPGIPSASYIRSGLLPVAAVHQSGANITAPNSKRVSQIADPAPNPLMPFGWPAANTSQVQGSAGTGDAVVGPSIPSPAASNAIFDSKLVTQAVYTAPIPPVPSSGTSTRTSQEQDSAKASDPVVASSESQNLSLAQPSRTSVLPLDTLPPPDANVSTFESQLGAQVANSASNLRAPSNVASISASAGKDSAQSTVEFVVRADSQNFSSAPSNQTKASLAGVSQQSAPRPTVRAVNSDAKVAVSTAKSEATLPKLSAPADLKNQVASLTGSANMPPSQVSVTEAPQGIDPGATSQTERKAASPAREAAPAQANPVEQIPQFVTTGNDPQFTQNLQTGVTPGPSARTVVPATKTMAAGLPALSSRDATHAQAANIAPPAPSSAAPAKQPSKDASNGSQGNDANTKPNHAASSGADHADAKGFVQSLEASGANSASTHATSTDSTIVAAAMRTPAEPHVASVETKLGSSNGSMPGQGQALPASAGAEQNVVSSAHLLDHAGQTEIRIEMQGGSLGGVELRAHMSGNDIGASIAVEHHDVQAMLANDLPALHNALIEKNLRVDYLNVSQGMPGSLSGGPGSDAGQRSFPQAHPKATYATRDEGPPAVVNNAAEYSGMTNPNSRLSVLA